MGADPGSYADFTLRGFTEALASPEPVPGGGSAAAVAGSIAASLTVMVASLSVNRPKYAAYAATHDRALRSGERARLRLLELADEDARAFAVYAAAMKLPRDSDDERQTRAAAMDAAARGASSVPLEVVRELRVLVEHVESLAGRSNLNASSDLDVAALLAQAAARGAAANVIINMSSISDQEAAGEMLAQVELLLDDIEAATARTHSRVQSGDLRDPEPA